MKFFSTVYFASISTLSHVSSPPPPQRPMPIVQTQRPEECSLRQLEAAKRALDEIPRHPLYLTEMQKIHGYIPEPVKLEMKDEDEDSNQEPSLPKRPISVGSNDNFPIKRRRITNGIQHMLVDEP